LYAVDYALSVKKLGLDAYALPAQIYHISAGASMSGEYYATLEKLLKKHRGAGWIYTTCGFWNALIPVGLQRIRIFQLATAGLVILFNNGPGIFLKTAHSFLTPKVVLSEFTFFLLPYAYMKTKTAGKGADLGELFDFAFYGVGGLIKPSQIKEEFLGLLGLVRKRKPKVLMEIGTNMGGSLYMLAKAAPEDATIISIDLPGGKYGGGYPLWKMPLYRSFARAKQGIHLIRGDSHKAGTLEKAKGMLAGRKVDFLFIDADHSYAGVKRDFEMYGPLVANGGVIAFHDIVVHPMGAYCDVNRFWARIKRSHRHVEMVKDWGQRGFGIGVIFKP